MHANKQTRRTHTEPRTHTRTRTKRTHACSTTARACLPRGLHCSRPFGDPPTIQFVSVKESECLTCSWEQHLKHRLQYSPPLNHCLRSCSSKIISAQLLMAMFCVSWEAAFLVSEHQALFHRKHDQTMFFQITHKKKRQVHKHRFDSFCQH